MPGSPQLFDTGLFTLLAHAGTVVKLVLLMLMGASVFCWAIIIAKHRLLKSATKADADFLNLFWKSKSMEDIFEKSDKMELSPVACVFNSGFKELKKLTAPERATDGFQEIDNISRALTRAGQESIGKIEKHLNWLATTASSAPFIGLFGTVWGIMNSFRDIGATGAANLAVVAPGISEALIATAAGLAAAIPAVIAYNHFAQAIRKMGTEIDCFSQDLLNIIQRSLMSGKKR